MMRNSDPDNKKINHLAKIYQLLKNNYEFDPKEMNYIFSGVAFVFILFGFWGESDGSPYDFSFFLLAAGQVILLILITYNLFDFIPSVKKFLTLRFTNFFLIFTSGSLFVYSRSQTSIELNRIFEISAEPFTYSLYFGSILYFINNFLSYYFYFLFTSLILITINYISFLYEQRNNLGFVKRFLNARLYFLVLSLSLTYTVYDLKNNDVSYEALSYKLYVIAHKLDFDDKNKCNKIDINQSVIYIGPNKDKVLISNTPYPIRKDISLYDFIRDKNKDYLDFNNALKNGSIDFKIKDCYLDKKLN